MDRDRAGEVDTEYQFIWDKIIRMAKDAQSLIAREHRHPLLSNEFGRLEDELTKIRTKLGLLDRVSDGCKKRRNEPGVEDSEKLAPVIDKWDRVLTKRQKEVKWSLAKHCDRRAGV